MTTSASIQTAWNDYIFEHATIAAITPRVIFHPATQTSESEIEELYYGGEVNFFEVQIYRTIELVMTRAETSSYSVKITYYREQDPSSSNYETVRGIFDVLYPLVKTQLGSTWNGAIDYFNVRNDAIEVDEQSIDDRECWKCTFTFEGIKTEAY